jgi:hypothetical protein
MICSVVDFSVRACRVEHDLIVFPELLDKPAGLFITILSRGALQDLIYRAFAVDCSVDALLRGVDWEREVRIDVRPKPLCS